MLERSSPIRSLNGFGPSTILMSLPRLVARDRGGRVQYETPMVIDFGSIAAHTYDNPGEGDKMNEPIEPYHLDKFCEFSGGSDADNPICD
jgi:hypothetical protein